MIEPIYVATQVKRTGNTTEDVFYLVRRFMELNGFGPTLAEIGEMLDILYSKRLHRTSKSVAKYHLNMIEEFGWGKVNYGGKMVPGRITLYGGKWVYDEAEATRIRNQRAATER